MRNGPFKFGKASKAHYDTLDPRLQRLFDEAIKYVDFSITCGYRNQADQDKAFADGFSKVKYPHGKHNTLPSKAADVAPYPIQWQDYEGFTLLAGILYGIACTMGIRIRLGVDWDGDGYVAEHGFKDRPHVELLDD